METGGDCQRLEETREDWRRLLETGGDCQRLGETAWGRLKETGET